MNVNDIDSKQLTILLIDDSEIDLFIHQKLIESVHPNCNIIKFQRTDEALAFLKLKIISDNKFYPDFILLDLYMPTADEGFRFLNEYGIIEKQIKHKSPIYILTCSLNPIDRIKSFLYNSVMEYSIKPLTLDTINNLLASYKTFQL